MMIVAVNGLTDANRTDKLSRLTALVIRDGVRRGARLSRGSERDRGVPKGRTKSASDVPLGLSSVFAGNIVIISD